MVSFVDKILSNLTPQQVEYFVEGTITNVINLGGRKYAYNLHEHDNGKINDYVCVLKIGYFGPKVLKKELLCTTRIN